MRFSPGSQSWEMDSLTHMPCGAVATSAGGTGWGPGLGRRAQSQACTALAAGAHACTIRARHSCLVWRWDEEERRVRAVPAP